MAVKRMMVFISTLIILTCVSFALSSHFWISFMFKGTKYHAGLWSVCEGEDCKAYSDWLPSVPKWLEQVRILVIVAGVLAVISVVTSVLSLYQGNVKSYLPAISMLLIAALVGGACLLYSQNKDIHYPHVLESMHYKWGFYVAATAASLSFVFMIFGALAHIECGKDETENVYGYV